ncbi:hypothetical protein [Paracoccus sp. KR1-242]|uniref:hypothetical protein n=1 Tax=Paracoccus sp. KR1-242 TaxID=3410028 RepID=UPI003C01A119
MARHELNFLEFIQSFRRGELLETGDQKMTELIEAIRETGGSGSLTFKASFKMNKAGQIEVEPDIQIKKPTRSMGSGIYFATDDGRLTRSDPNQMEFGDQLAPRRSSEF